MLALAFATMLARVAVSAPADLSATVKLLQSSDDFRVRVEAALKLGSSGDARARKPLEQALDDAHPNVRQAAAAALAKLGDELAIPALETREKRESNVLVKNAVHNAISSLRGSAVGGSATTATGAIDWSKTRFVLKLDPVNNGTAVRGSALAAVLEGSAREKLSHLDGVVVVPAGAGGASVVATAQSKGVPVLGVGAGLAALDQENFAGDLKVQARVTFTFSKSSTIKASLEGKASTIGSQSAASNPKSLAKLQDMAVEGAVASALNKAPSALLAAAK
jgi:hypothetical protein